MSTSTKTPASIRQGGPGSSKQNAKAPLEVKKPPADGDQSRHSGASSGGGEKDVNHAHRTGPKGQDAGK